MDDERDERPDGILSGVRVVEVAAWVAGPAAAGILADWGADVIKVEPATGDPQRNVFGAVGVADQTAMPPFEIDNRGKRSVVLDLRRDGGPGRRWIACWPRPTCSSRTRGSRRSSGWASTPPASAPAIPASSTGSSPATASTGPDADRPGYDVGAFWARSSLAASVVPKGRLPPAIRSGLGDHVTGMTLAGGIAAALFDRERTGRGHLVSTSLLRTGIYAAGWDIGDAAALRQAVEHAIPGADQHPADELLPGRRRPRLLAARARGRPPLARPRRRHRAGRPRRRRALRHRPRRGSATPRR